ncbi:MAG: recombinase family protein, partial [Pseudorhodoplanes sp.]|nr:recombinase family protein [Pseudorhodoplanes sp.]
MYTRKSSEEGLEQDFNSLQAQREACESYIASQKHEGWKVLSNTYDDGGYSGGSIERPALRQLLTNIKAGSIDVVVVYKVDRLTRSLSDFAKIVEIFDAQGVSFVSVTQQFNTTTSMGRLTLNVLLSFAQFEREVTGERIRDKVAASKKKGMWMGGWVPIGYDLKDRSLHINEAEAKTVRTIFQLYLELGNVNSVQTELERRKLTTKPRATVTGRMIGALPFRRGHIYHILSNPIYAGEIRHKDLRHLGQHPALIDRRTWDAVQSQLRANGQKHKTRADATSANLLAGLLFDDQGNRFTPTHSINNGKRYRYYAVLPPSGRSSKKVTRPALRIAASEIEALVVDELKAYLTDHKRLVESLAADGMRPSELKNLLRHAKTFASAIEKDVPAESQIVLAQIVKRIAIAPE